jgi:MinD superfamily P-loop ATPase
MHEILVISGKGGTGKTSLTAAFSHLAADPVICDLDVDAPDLHLLLKPKNRETHEFYSGFEAVINPDKCDACGTCLQMCRYQAVLPGPAYPAIDPLKCEGCKVCVQFCPADAIAFTPRHCGRWHVADTRFGPLVHAQLFPAQENSGRLVALLRKQAKELARARGSELILADGPPGIGCPVISALSGVRLAVIVTEPTPSGRHDMERIVELCSHFGIPAAVIINKCDLNEAMAERIQQYCRQKDMAVVARLPHDPEFVHAMVRAQTVTESSNSETAQRIKKAWGEILALARGTTGLADSVQQIKTDQIECRTS